MNIIDICQNDCPDLSECKYFHVQDTLRRSFLRTHLQMFLHRVVQLQQHLPQCLSYHKPLSLSLMQELLADTSPVQCLFSLRAKEPTQRNKSIAGECKDVSGAGSRSLKNLSAEKMPVRLCVTDSINSITNILRSSTWELQLYQQCSSQDQTCSEKTQLYHSLAWNQLETYLTFWFCIRIPHFVSAKNHLQAVVQECALRKHSSVIQM